MGGRQKRCAEICAPNPAEYCAAAARTHHRRHDRAARLVVLEEPDHRRAEEEGPIRYCPPNENCKHKWTGAVVDARLPITRFIDGTVVYLVSKEVTDLLSIYIFHIKPLPGCGSDAAAANATGLALPASCEAAPSAEQFNFAGIILLLSLIHI